ncbi:hypothetical protein Rs2_43260 [Raphanus sativus]|nr:hypothetical protein Rs2_43260 [Raphanus sativus]
MYRFSSPSISQKKSFTKETSSFSTDNDSSIERERQRLVSRNLHYPVKRTSQIFGGPVTKVRAFTPELFFAGRLKLVRKKKEAEACFAVKETFESKKKKIVVTSPTQCRTRNAWIKCD